MYEKLIVQGKFIEHEFEMILADYDCDEEGYCWEN